MKNNNLINRLKELKITNIDGVNYVEEMDIKYLIKKHENDSKYFNIDDKVRVIASHNNASQFNGLYPDLKYTNGVYQFDNWQEMIFTIIDTYKPVNFKTSPNIYGAYPLSYEDVFVGYVYSDALELA